MERSKILEEKRRAWKRKLLVINPDQEKAFNEMMDLLEVTANDAAYFRSIIIGDNPHAESILENALAAVRMKKV